MLKNLLKSWLPGAQPAAAPQAAPEPPGPDERAQAEALVAQGNAAEDAGRLQDAHGLYLQAVALAPDLPKTHLNLGIAEEALGDAIAARARYEKVLALEPGHPYGAYNLAKLHYLQGRLGPAEALLRQAVAAREAFADAWLLLSNVLDAQGRTADAAEAIERTLRLQPDYPGALYNQAMLLRRLDRLDEAEAALARAAQLAPDPAILEMHCNVLTAQGLAEQALQPLRAAIALRPDSFTLRCKELFLLNLVDGVDPAELWQKHRALGEQVEAIIPERTLAPRDPARQRLRLGFVSGELRSHPVALFLLPVLQHLRRERFEVSCYSTSAQQDHVSAQLRQASDHWVEAAGWSDEQLTDAIVAAGIDILVDLGGHSGDMHLGAFVPRAAPVQLTWLGYLNTTGLTRMDWRLTDAVSDPPEQSQPLHSERLLLLPHSQWCYRPFLAVEPAAAAPCERNGFVTFGSFNKAMKLTPLLAQRWGRILQALPTARLLVADVGSERKRAELLAGIQAGGGDAAQVQFVPRLDLQAYYRLADQVDIALDSQPYGGGTTTFDALWMGVPVLTARGPLPASRSAASVLSTLGLHDWIAPSIEGYEALAIERASDAATIATLRRTLRGRLQASPLMDEAGFTAAFEAALERAWQDRTGAS